MTPRVLHGSIAMTRPFNPRQLKFVELYLAGYTATDAYVDAGCAHHADRGWTIGIGQRLAIRQASVSRSRVVIVPQPCPRRVIDQYQVTEDAGIQSDPNRADDPEYIVNLVGQMVKVSVGTGEIVNALPEKYSA